LLIHVKHHMEELGEFDLMFSDSPPECSALIPELLGLPRIDIKPAGFGMRLYHDDISLVSYISEIFSSGSGKMSFAERVENSLYYTLLTAAKPIDFALYNGLWREFGLPEERTFQDSINMAEMAIIIGHFALEYPQPFLPGYIPDDLASNVKVVPWFPQNAILAHNSTKAFISHTGLNSLYEAAFYGVPLFADQYSNCVQAHSVGMATGINIKTTTGDEIYFSIRRILEESSFKGNATRTSRLLRDS
ncbi:hypothetical protein ACROYT_G029022, partial [Oculina patagonica]